MFFGLSFNGQFCTTPTSSRFEQFDLLHCQEWEDLQRELRDYHEQGRYCSVGECYDFQELIKQCGQGVRYSVIGDCQVFGCQLTEYHGRVMPPFRFCCQVKGWAFNVPWCAAITFKCQCLS